jgi:hypothetical protein
MIIHHSIMILAEAMQIRGASFYAWADRDAVHMQRLEKSVYTVVMHAQTA